MDVPTDRESIRVPLARIHTDGGTQPRVTLDPAVIAEYADLMAGGVEFPPVIVFDDGQDAWLADGFHRLEAARRVGCVDISAEIRPGTRRDAVLYAVGANAAHGLRRTNADKRRAILTLLNDPEWAQWSDREIARRCGVNQSTVSRLRAEQPSDALHKIESPRLVQRNGTTYQMQTANIGTQVDAGVEVQPDAFPDPDSTAILVSDEQLHPPAPPARASRMNDGMYSSATGQWATPRPLIEILDTLFGFEIDVCATPDNAACDRYFTEVEDGLLQDWSECVCYMNPPYGDSIGRWVAKAYREATQGATVVCLLPARTDTRWFRDYCWAHARYLLFFYGRLRFGDGTNSAPFPSVLAVFSPRSWAMERLEPLGHLIVQSPLTA